MRLPCGFFWVALARASSPEAINDARWQPQRERRPVEREGFVNSYTAIQGSSPISSSPSEFELSVPSIDGLGEDEHEALRNKPEDITVHLVGCFLQCTLSLCLIQDPNGNSEIRPRMDRRRETAHISGTNAVAAEDDGGICKVDKAVVGWETSHPYLALLEAKKAFKSIIFDELAGHNEPIVPHDTLAQCLGEAVIAWKANRALLKEELVSPWSLFPFHPAVNPSASLLASSFSQQPTPTYALSTFTLVLTTRRILTLELRAPRRHSSMTAI